MPVFTRDNISLHYLDEGEGRPLLFLHEFGGDSRTWEEQVDFFANRAAERRRCLVLSARGYPPSDVPQNAENYGWRENLADALGLLEHLGIETADVVGLSMGAYIALLMAIEAPQIISSAVCASIGSGAHPPTRQAFIADARGSAEQILATGQVPAEAMAKAPNRIQLWHKNRAAWQRFCDHLAEHPAVGAAHTLARVQAERPGLHDFSDQLGALSVPVFILAGDEDEPCLDASLWLKRQMPLSGLKLYARAGHLLNLEEPDSFHADIVWFHQMISSGQWYKRDATVFASMFQDSTDNS